MVLTLWFLRKQNDSFDPSVVYGENPSIFSVKIFHGGVFINNPVRSYVDGNFNYVDMIDADEFSVHEVNAMIQEIGYPKEQIMFYHFKVPDMNLSRGLRTLATDQDVLLMLQYVSKFKVIELYVEHWVSRVNIFYNSPPSNVFIETIEDPEQHNHVRTKQKKAKTCRKLLELEWQEVEGQHEDDVQNEQEVQHEDEVQHEVQDDDVLEDRDNMVEDVIVDMESFKATVEGDFNVDQENMDGDAVNIDIDDFESGSDDEDLLNTALKKFRKKKKHEKNVEAVPAPFKVGQKFSNKMEIRTLIESHALETRRQLLIVKNDKERFRVVCSGVIPVFVSGGQNGNTSEVIGESEKVGGPKSVGESSQVPRSSQVPKKKGKPAKGVKAVVPRKKHPKPTCPWTLHVSRKGEENPWLVKTFKEVHKCLQTRDVKLYTVSCVAKEVEQIIDTNPEIPIKALQDQIQKKHQVQVSKQKAFRARVKAKNKLHGDYETQYSILRDYCYEILRSNPESTVKIDVEREYNQDSETRQFRRIYICLGALKAGFKLSGRELLGLDGCFMKGPYPGQVLTAVGIDANNGIYPVAYAIVESESCSSWTWFLKNLGGDLDLNDNSNFTFISDRQKGIIPAIEKVYPSAEHRYCLRHIHENMKSKWRGDLFKELLWKCASATTVPQFNRRMERILKQDKSLHEWLKAIPAKHWARSHFSGRSKCDVLLNNLCEVFNKKLVGGRDKPIITCLEYIREYIMRRIGVVNKIIDKCEGPLTPAATKTFDLIKTLASQYNVMWNGQNKYQVNGPWNDQCVVDVGTRTCSCRKWELTGMPCKHAVAVNYNMASNGVNVGIPESWVAEVYWLDTWRKVYQNAVEPINGRELWSPYNCPSKLLPPKHHKQVGRPKKARKRSAEELSEKIQSAGKLTRKGAPVTCGLCKGRGHNKRTCSEKGASSNVEQQTSQL